MENKTFITADAERNIPVTEPERQYYFIEKAKEKLTKLKEEELHFALQHSVVR